MWSLYQKSIINMEEGHASLSSVLLKKETELMHAYMGSNTCNANIVFAMFPQTLGQIHPLLVERWRIFLINC